MMKKWKYTSLVVTVLGALIFYCTHGYAFSKDDYQNQFRKWGQGLISG